jgi:hypothetical protein
MNEFLAREFWRFVMAQQFDMARQQTKGER